MALLRRWMSPLVAVALLACQKSTVVNSGGEIGGGGAGGNSGSPTSTNTPPNTIPLPPQPTPVGAEPGSAADAATCVANTCTPAGGRYCGRIGNGCGTSLDCGGCPAGQTCGGGGVRGVCGSPPDPGCKPIGCQQTGAQLCGRVGDGCGGALECGDCPTGVTCGATVANVCGSGSDPASGVGSVCDNLCMQRPVCPGGQKTTLTGTVFAPTRPEFGRADPLYNAMVYIPNRPVQPFSAAVACEACGTPVSGSPIAIALSGPDGKFTLENVPAGNDIPLVIQIGRWRRQVTIPSVTACANTNVPAELSRLPRNQREGNIPKIAVVTGRYDQFECLLRKIGVDDAEFTVPSGNGRVHLFTDAFFQLSGTRVPPGSNLYQDPATLGQYDVVVIPCNTQSDRKAAELANVRGYTDKGGRLFITDYSYTWLRDGGPFESAGKWLPISQYVGAEDYSAQADESFPKGRAFADWLAVVGASKQRGLLPIHDPYRGRSYLDGVVAPTQRWLYTQAPLIDTVQHLTFNTPVGAPDSQQCGRVVYSTFHVAEDNGLSPISTRQFPRQCSQAPMSPQEKALEFMLFDASNCVQPDRDPPRVFTAPPLAPPPPPQVID